MKKLIALVAVTVCVAYATTYIQTSPTGAAPWKPVKDSVSLAHLADSARHAPPSAYADSSRTSGLADSAKRAGWAPLDSGRVRGIMSDTAAALRGAMSAYLPLSGGSMSGNIVMPSGSAYGSITWPGGQYIYGDASGILHLQGSTRIAGSQYVTENDTIEGSLKVFGGITGTLTGSISGNAGTATKLATARTIATSGDATGTATSFDGSANITIPTTVTKINGTALSGLATGILKNTTSTGVPSIAVAGTDYLSPSTGVSSITATSPIVASASVGAVTLTHAAFGTAGTYGSATAVPVITTNATGHITSVTSTSISIPHTQISDWSTYINQALLTTSSPTFAGLTTSSVGTTGTNFTLTGSESDNITNINYRNGVITTNSPANGGAQRQGLQFNWYANNYTIGIIRGVSTDDAGLGITYSGGTNLRWRCTNGTTYDYNALTVTGLITANGGITGTLTGHASLDLALSGGTMSGDLTSHNLIPYSNNSFSLGSPSYRYNYAYTNYLNVQNDVVINGFTTFGGNVTLNGLLALTEVTNIPSGTTDITPVAGLVIPFSCSNYTGLSTIKFGYSATVFFRNYNNSGVPGTIGDQVAVNGATGINVSGVSGSVPARSGVIYCLSATSVLVLL